MDISKTDSKKMQELASEGKQIKRILEDYFPHLSYSDVYFEVRGGGGRSALGVKRMITARINAIAANKKTAERNEMAEELNELVWQLYKDHKTNHNKLTRIREALDE